jgi:hypothetical protein
MFRHCLRGLRRQDPKKQDLAPEACQPCGIMIKMLVDVLAGDLANPRKQSIDFVCGVVVVDADANQATTLR